MKIRFTVAAGWLACAGAAIAAGPTIPQRPGPEAFQNLTENWPFALATPPAAAPVEPTKGWASNYYVAGIGKSYESGSEEMFVAIKSKDGQESFSLYGKQPNRDDISIGGIEWSEKVGKSRVTLKKGTEFATIEFDQVAIAPAANATMPRPGGPVVPAPRGAPAPRPGMAIPKPTNVSGIPQPVPAATLPANTGAAMPSNTNSAPSNTNILPGGSGVNPPAAGGSRQRVRVIKAP